MQTEVKTRPELAIYPEMPPVARELQLTRDFLASHGWMQGNFSDGEGNYCIMGSWTQVRNIYADSSNEGRVQTTKICRFIAKSTGSESAAMWNDAPGRTKTEVLAALDRAVALALAAGE